MKEIQATKSLEMLDRSVAALRERQVPAMEEIQVLFQKVSSVEQEIEQEIFQSGPYIRHLNWLYHKMFGSLNKIGKMHKLLQDALALAEQHKKDIGINKVRWELKRKGLYCHLPKEEAEAALTGCITQMQAIHCPHAFTFLEAPEKEGHFELLIFTAETNELQSHTYAHDAKECTSIEALLAKLAPYAMPLSQLQEVADWLQAHASGELKMTQILSTRMVEQKLSELLKVHPQGVYILHPCDTRNSLTLSRIQQKGTIQHLTVDLEKQLGHYTICDEQGQEASKTLVQFRRTLGQMGNPLRITSTP